MYQKGFRVTLVREYLPGMLIVSNSGVYGKYCYFVECKAGGGGDGSCVRSPVGFRNIIV